MSECSIESIAGEIDVRLFEAKRLNSKDNLLVEVARLPFVCVHEPGNLSKSENIRLGEHGLLSYL